MNQQISPYSFRDGLKEGIPIALGYLSVSFGFGITAVGKGLRWFEALIISLTNVTSAGQIAALSIIAACGTLLEMFLTQLVINLRYSLMGIALSQRLDNNCTLLRRFLMSFLLTDEIFAVASSKEYYVGPKYYYGLMILPYFGWATGTLLGSLAGNILPEDISNALGIMIYAMFIAILIPVVKKNFKTLIVACLAAVLSAAIYFLPFLSFITSGFSIIICTIISACIGAWLFPIDDEKETTNDGGDGS